MSDTSFTVDASIPVPRRVRQNAPPRARAGPPATKARHESLPGLVSKVRKNNRQEDVVWLILGLSAAALLVLRLSI